MSDPAPASASVDAPVADWLDPAQMMRDPYPSYARLREMGPVVYVPAIRRHLLTTHAAVVAAEQHPEQFSSYSERNLTMVRALGGRRPMLRKDDPEHAAERSAINPTLRPRQVTDIWSPRFRENVERYLDRLESIGPAMADLNRDFAAPVASQNLIDMLGFPEDVRVEDLHRWSTDFIAGTGNLLDDPAIWARCDRSQAEVGAVLDELLPRLRRTPDGSITSHLVEVGLPDEVVRANVLLTISGGMNEPQHMVSNMVWALDGHPDQLELLREGEASWGAAFEEAVRWLSPIGKIPREVRVPIEDFLGVRLEEGSDVGLLLASANRDEAVFPDADAFEVRRNARGHLAFGQGAHMCAGKWAAKSAIGETALPMLYERFPRLRVDRARETTWDGWVFRGITALPVTW